MAERSTPKQIASQVAPTTSGVLFGTGNSSTRAKTAWVLAEEVPLVLYYNGEQFGLMMVTPHDLKDFAIGFSLTEKIVSDASLITDVRIQETGDGLLANVIVPDEKAVDLTSKRRVIAGTASCGLCGAQSVQSALPPPPPAYQFAPEPEAVLRAFAALPAHQNLNQQNRSTHAAALCDAMGNIVLVREDVGRHNGLDKLCGAMALADQSAEQGFLLLSSRFSVEMAQKMAIMRFGFVASISAPTSLALQVSSRAGARVGTLVRDENGGDEVMIFDPSSP